MNLTERDEYNLFNKLFKHCEFINQLTKQATFFTKYQLCAGYKVLNGSNSLKSYINAIQTIFIIIGLRFLNTSSHFY